MTLLIFEEFPVRIPADAHIHHDRVPFISSSGSICSRHSIGTVCGTLTITFSLTKKEGLIWTREKVQEKISSTGYRALVTSLALRASEIDEIYQFSASTEHLISQLKKGIGCTDEAGLENLIFTAFVSAIVRWEIGKSYKKHHLQERKMIRKVSMTGFA